MSNLSRTANESVASERGIPLPSGFVDLYTDSGVRHVNPAQVAYVCDDAPLRLAGVFSEQLTS